MPPCKIVKSGLSYGPMSHTSRVLSSVVIDRPFLIKPASCCYRRFQASRGRAGSLERKDRRPSDKSLEKAAERLSASQSSLGASSSASGKKKGPRVDFALTRRERTASQVDYNMRIVIKRNTYFLIVYTYESMNQLYLYMCM